MSDKARFIEGLGVDCLSPSEFIRGAEVGMLAERLAQCAGEVRQIVRTDNAENMLRLGEALGRVVVSEEIGEGCMWVTFAPPQVPPWP